MLGGLGGANTEPDEANRFGSSFYGPRRSSDSPARVANGQKCLGFAVDFGADRVMKVLAAVVHRGNGPCVEVRLPGTHRFSPVEDPLSWNAFVTL